MAIGLPRCACDVVSKTTKLQDLGRLGCSATRAHKELRLQLSELYLVLFKDLMMSSDTISVMRHNNSCGKTLLDNWVEEVRI